MPRILTLKRILGNKSFVLWLHAGLRKTAAPFHQKGMKQPWEKNRKQMTNCRALLLASTSSSMARWRKTTVVLVQKNDLIS
uniref:Uncharacterized protein n=1 Tax=Mus musculus TaxID=10090 RepID=Q3U022_MOUSE|nr:unnamed protein product [Mus musculus]